MMDKNIDGHVLIWIDAHMSVVGMYSVYMWVRCTGMDGVVSYIPLCTNCCYSGFRETNQ
jgi:hypothetical protein